MNHNTLVEKSELIWATLNSIQNEKLTKEEQLTKIQYILLQISDEERQIGRNQITNLISETIKNISK